MKTQFINLISKVTLLSAMVLLTSVASTQAQSLTYRLKANIPFDFTVGEKKLPAGEYTVGRAVHGSDDVVLAISDLAGHAKAIRLTNATIRSQRNKQSSLVFHRYGDQYFLFQVFPSGATGGRQFPESKSEKAQRRMAKNSVAENMKCETVTIAVALQ